MTLSWRPRLSSSSASGVAASNPASAWAASRSSGGETYLTWPAGKSAQPPGGRHRALHHVVVVAVHRVPGQAESGRLKRPAGRGQEPWDLGEPVHRPGPVLDATVRMPVPVVFDGRAGHALVLAEVAGIGQHPLAVEQVDVRTQLVELAVVGGIAGHDREVDRRTADRRPLDRPDRAHHGLGDLVGEQFLGPVAADDADLGAERGIQIGVPIEQLRPRRGLVVHDVRIGQVRDHHQRPGRSPPVRWQARLRELGPDLV